MRLLICAGGTGGGVYPALAVLQALTNNPDPILWVGSEKGMEANLLKPYLQSSPAGVTFTTIPAAGVHGVGLRQLPSNLSRLAHGYSASQRILKQFKPDVLFFTGGYLAVPMALAGHGIPSLSYVPDIEPGLALRATSFFSKQVALTAPESSVYYRGRRHLIISGYPTRLGLQSWSKEQACHDIGLQTNEPILLVTGGSKGAHSINQAVFHALPTLLRYCQVVHLTGELDWPLIPSVQTGLTKEVANRYHPLPYIHEMGKVLACADLVISRAGASILGEYPLFGLPAILVPYPYAWRYQKVNADYLTKHHAAVMIEDSALPERLEETVRTLLSDQSRLEAMKAAMHTLSKPQAAQTLANELMQLAQPSRRKK